MAVSQRKMLANQRNARKSTGPRTAGGKKRSSMNAMFHGVFSVDDVLPGENAEVFATLRDEMLMSMMPQNGMELSLCERIISCTWRLRRVQSAQRYLYEMSVNESFEKVLDAVQDPAELAEYTVTAEHLPAGGVLMTLIAEGPDRIDRLARYEHRLDQVIHRCLRQLHVLQDPRRHRPKMSQFLLRLSPMRYEAEEAVEEPVEETAVDEAVESTIRPVRGRSKPRRNVRKCPVLSGRSRSAKTNPPRAGC
jgi:hypothetical protein